MPTFNPQVCFLVVKGSKFRIQVAKNICFFHHLQIRRCGFCPARRAPGLDRIQPKKTLSDFHCKPLQGHMNQILGKYTPQNAWQWMGQEDDPFLEMITFHGSRSLSFREEVGFGQFSSPSSSPSLVLKYLFWVNYLETCLFTPAYYKRFM